MSSKETTKGGLSQADAGGKRGGEASRMKYYLSKSLYWYVQKSLEDMTNDFMTIGKESSKTTDDIAERSEIVSQMFELPLEFDSVSKQLAVDVVVRAIQRNCDFTDGCAALVVGVTRKKSEIADMFKKDFIAMLENVFFQEDTSPQYGQEVLVREQLDQQDLDESTRKTLMVKLKGLQSTILKKGRRYSKLLVELFRRRFLTGTQLVVFLDKLSRQSPNYFVADVLIFILQEIGLELESRVSKASSYRSTPVKATSSSDHMSTSRDSHTFDTIYKRLDSFLTFAMSSKSVLAIQKVIQDRKRKKCKRTTSAEELLTVTCNRGGGGRGQYSFNRSPSRCNKENKAERNTDEAATTL